MAKTTLCETCVFSIYCPTWSELKCRKQEKRFSTYGHQQPTKCSDYKKRGTDFEEPKCQCKSCFENENLWDEESED